MAANSSWNSVKDASSVAGGFFTQPGFLFTTWNSLKASCSLKYSYRIFSSEGTNQNKFSKEFRFSAFCPLRYTRLLRHACPRS